MNENERNLLRAVVNGDSKAVSYAKTILEGITAQKDLNFKDNLLKKLEERKKFELPMQVRDLLIAENMENFPIERYLLRDEEKRFSERIIAIYRASQKLSELNIRYLPAAILHGESGTGKTELARYIAYKAGLLFVYVRFSALINSYLGGTQSNLNKVFSFAKTYPCLLCFDEIDAIGMKRGDTQDVSEMNRVTIAMMQEMDTMPNNVLIVGTTNRFDRLDPALKRRFPIHHIVELLDFREICELVSKFFSYCGVPEESGWVARAIYHENQYDVIKSHIQEDLMRPVSDVIAACTDYIVDYFTRHEEETA